MKKPKPNCCLHVLGLFLLILPVFSLVEGCSSKKRDDNRDDARIEQSASFARFKKEVIPLFEERCSLSCHGVPDDGYDDFMKRDGHGGQFFFPIDPLTARIRADRISRLELFRTTVGEKGASSGRGTRIDYSETPDFSPLLRYPLVEEYGGLPHAGLDVFSSPADPAYEVLRNWIALEIARKPENSVSPSEALLFFRDNVLGVMLRNGCFLTSCHGPDAFNDLKLQPPLPVTDGASPLSGFSAAMVQANREVMLGKVTRFANLGGDLEKSRLIVKNLPIAEGGVHQRGGNNQFFESLEDRDVKILLQWLRLERRSLARQLRSGKRVIAEEELGRLKGIAFIRGPRHNRRRFFDADPFVPGSDIYLSPSASGKGTEETGRSPVNLTAPYHDGQLVDIHSLDVRYDGRAIVFSMRSSAESPFRLYEMRLREDLSGAESLRQISFGRTRLDDGTLIHHLDPLYIPLPDDAEGHDLARAAVVYASNEAGAYTPSSPWGIPGEADGGDTLVLVDKQRPERAGTFTGRRIYFVDGPNKGAWRRIVDHRANAGAGTGARLVLDSPLPARPDRRTVYVIEAAGGETLPAYDIWRFVPAEGEAEAAFNRTARRMTFTSAQERRPTMRTSGEVMFTSLRNIGYQADRPVFNGAIFRVQGGGFDYHIHGGNRSRYPLYSDSRELPSGLEVRLALDPANYGGGGALFLVDHGLGINAEPDNPMDSLPYGGDDAETSPLFSSPPRYIPSQVPLFPEGGSHGVTHTGLSPGGSFRDPYPLPDGSILVSYVQGAVDHLDAHADPDWDIYLLRPGKSLQSEDGRRGGHMTLTRIGSASSALADYSPRPVMVRLKERAETHQKFKAGMERKKLKDEGGILHAPEDTPAEVECYDYPLLQSFLTHFAPAGGRYFHEADGDPSSRYGDERHRFRYVRVLMHEPPGKGEAALINAGSKAGDPFATPVSSGVHGRKVIVAEVPLESDGSFYVEVPPNVPLALQGLNEKKMALHSMNRWFYLQPGEKLTFSIPRSIFPLRCAGCHGALTGDPADGIGPPNLVSASSKVMATWEEVTRKRREPYGRGRRPSSHLSIDFRRDLQPILDDKCISCHGSGAPAAGLDLTGKATPFYTTAYESLHRLEDAESGNFADKRYINEREGLAIESFLMEKLTGSRLDGPLRGTLLPGRKHPEENPLSDKEILAFIRWIDLGAPFLGGPLRDE